MPMVALIALIETSAARGRPDQHGHDSVECMSTAHHAAGHPNSEQVPYADDPGHSGASCHVNLKKDHTGGRSVHDAWAYSAFSAIYRDAFVSAIDKWQMLVHTR